MKSLSDEQIHVCEKALDGSDLVVKAFAGTGKSTTLTHAADLMRDGGRRVLYMVFNKAMQQEAKFKFGEGIEVRTIHSIAFSSMPEWMKAKVSYKQEPYWMLAQRYGLSEVRMKGSVNEVVHIQGVTQARLIRDAVGIFCQSSELEIKPHHIPRLDGLSEQDNDRFASWLYEKVLRYWSETLSRQSPNGITHDVYLKLWSMASPKIEFDSIIVDEAQDTDEVSRCVIESQPGQKIWVGDPYQQIYSWRGARDTLNTVQGERLSLRGTYRFGPEIAEKANAVLSLLGEDEGMVGMGPEGKVHVERDQEDEFDVVLCRSNQNVLLWAMDLIDQQKCVKIETDTAELKKFCEGSGELMAGKRTVKSKDLELFRNWSEVLQFSESVAGQTVGQMVRLIERNGWQEVLDIIEKCEDQTIKADVTVSTAHKSKGKQWNCVLLDDDYPIGEKDQANDEELRLLYVAMTRAKKDLYLDRIQFRLNEELSRNEVVA